ncbi:MAG: TatD family hydrolase [Minisyncoccia bacterium]
MKYIDIHSHLGFDDYGTDQKEVIKRMQDADVATIVVGADLESSKEAVKVATENENIWACVGMHPNDNPTEVFNEKNYEELVKNPKVVAIGECGLDYFFKDESLALEGLSLEKVKQKQKENFIKQIEFAIKYKKPLMLHIRDAHDDAYEILKKYEGKVFGNLHFFTSSLKNAERFIGLGFTISFPGIITYLRDFDKVIKSIPLDKIHAETDSPYASPLPHRGERNEPSYVIEVYKKIAEIRGEDPEKVRLQLLENAKKVFSI